MLSDSTRSFSSNIDEPQTKPSPEISSLSLKSNFALYQKSLPNTITDVEPTDDTPQIVVNLKVSQLLKIIRFESDLGNRCRSG